MFNKSFIDENVLKEDIENKKKFFDLFFTCLIFMASFGFFFVGLFSFFNLENFFFINTKGVVFFPQGLVMCFYGFFGLIASVLQFFTIYYEVGYGYNEFNKRTASFTLYRKGYPGKNSEVKFIYSLNDIVRYY